MPGVQVVEPIYRTYFSVRTGQGSGSIDLNSLSADPRLRWSQLESGRWPQRLAEIALSTGAADHLGLTVGDTLHLVGYGEKAESSAVTVGLSTTERSLFGGVQDSGFMTTAALTTLPDFGGTPEFLLIGTPGTDAGDLAARVDTAVGSSPYAADRAVTTTAEAANELVDGLAGGIDVFRSLLLVFGAIALLVGTIIIANTFTILVAQRRRQVALLRAVGASTSQVRQTS